MLITVETRINNEVIRTIDTLPAALIVHAYDKYEHVKKVFDDLKTPERQAMGGGTSYVGPNVHVKMHLNNVNPVKFNNFLNVYCQFLAANMAAKPDEYMQSFGITLQNMAFSIAQGTFNKDTESFKQTCKALKIKHTYKAIDEYLERVK
jgi:hypothetical protein